MWPPLPDDWARDPTTVANYRELRLAAEIAVAKDDREKSPSPPPSPADDGSEIKLHDTLATLVVGSIDRARDGAKFVETAAAALGSIYTGILAFTFAASGSHLPARGLYAAIFLGLAIVGSSFYLAFIQQIPPIGRVQYRNSRPEDQWRRTEYLGAWTQAVVRTRSWALRCAVIALAWGVMFMPVAFLPNSLPDLSLAMALPQGSLAPTGPQFTPVAELTWPPAPPGIPAPEVAAVLYKAQLDEFEKSKSDGATVSAQGSSTDVWSFRAFLLAALALVVVALWDHRPKSWSLRRRRRRDQTRNPGRPGGSTRKPDEPSGARQA